MTKARWDKIKSKYPAFTKAEFEWIVYSVSQAAWDKFFEAQKAYNPKARKMLLADSEALNKLCRKLYPSQGQEYKAAD